MKLHVAARGGLDLSGGLRDYIDRRVHFSLGRFAGRIRRLSVRIADVNGPRGGVDKSCHIRVDAGLRQQVVVREQQSSVHAAVAFAAERAERALRRQLNLAASQPRRAGAQPDPKGL